jgi:SAM-dependent methyltransferase
MPEHPNEWRSVAHALDYLARADAIPHRVEGESALLEEIPEQAERVLDLGTGDGRLLALVLLKCPGAAGVAVDFSPVMLEKCAQRFRGDERVEVVDHDLSLPLPALGTFDVVVSSFAIHHVSDARKREVYAEVWALLRPRGVFCNLEHVSSVSQRLHEKFMYAIGCPPEDEDPSNQLLDAQSQLDWLRQIGFVEVDCLWKWRELALLRGGKP